VSQGQKNFYDYLHFSPLKVASCGAGWTMAVTQFYYDFLLKQIHVSFSMGGATKLSNSFLNLLIASLGVSVTEVQDVVFKYVPILY
jgi:hypothetical protein